MEPRCEILNSINLLGGGIFPDYRPENIVVSGNVPYGIQLMSGGGVNLTVDHWEHYEMTDGIWLFCTAPDRHMEFAPHPDHGYWDHRYLHLTGSRADLWHLRGLLMPWPQRLPESRDWLGLFDEILAFQENDRQLNHWLAACRLEEFLIYLAEERVPSAHFPGWLQRVLIRLSTEDLVDPDYEELASQANMSLRNLRRCFKDYIGTTPHGYYLEQRMKRARALLGDPDRPLKAIADQLGYCDIYHFSRQFKRLNGMPPGAFRKSLPGR